MDWCVHIGCQGLKPCHAPSVPLVPPAAPPWPAQLLLPHHRHHAQAQPPPWRFAFQREALQRQRTKHNSDQCMPKLPLSPCLSGSPLSVPLWLCCRVGGVHSLRGGADEVRRLCPHGALRKRVLHGPLVKKAPRVPHLLPSRWCIALSWHTGTLEGCNAVNQWVDGSVLIYWMLPAGKWEW